jgi:hypothetical protein
MISVCTNQSRAILAFAGFSKGTVERVFRMPVPAARRCILKVRALSIICRRLLVAPVRQVLIVFCKPAGSPRVTARPSRHTAQIIRHSLFRLLTRS